MNNYLWILCLDKSASMRDGFNASRKRGSAFTGSTEPTSQQAKIDAARAAIVKELRQLDPSSDVLILAFNRSTELLYRGPAGDLQRISALLSAVEPGGGTDVADCLRKVAEYALKAVRVDCLMVTDGLASEGDPEAAARACNENGIVVNIALVDPTDKGEELARKITRNGGRMYAIKSAEELARSIEVEGIYQRLSYFESMSDGQFSELRANFRDTSERLQLAYANQRQIEERVSRLTQLVETSGSNIFDLTSDIRPLLQSLALGISIDEAPLRRYVPVRVYLRDGNPDSTALASRAVQEMLESISFVVAEDIPREIGSWWKRWGAKSKELLTHPELQERLTKIETSLEIHAINAPMAKVDKDLASATASLIKAVQNESEAALQVGSILVLKTTGPDGASRIAVRTLSPNQLAILEKNPNYLREPSELLNRLVAHSNSSKSYVPEVAPPVVLQNDSVAAALPRPKKFKKTRASGADKRDT